MSSKKPESKLPLNPLKGTRELKAVALEEGDYYFNEQGFMVFTEQYHLKRGFCCGSNCKHCPHGHENVK